MLRSASSRPMRTARRASSCHEETMANSAEPNEQRMHKATRLDLIRGQAQGHDKASTSTSSVLLTQAQRSCVGRT